jgi:hypothetical protein
MPSTITTTEMNYKEGPVDTREYDACHYMIVSGSVKDDKSGARRLDGHGGEDDGEDMMNGDGKGDM